MARKRFTAEQIIMKLREAEVGLASAPEAKLPRSQALNPIPWSGLQRVSGLT